jgi:hypothetical protein
MPTAFRSLICCGSCARSFTIVLAWITSRFRWKPLTSKTRHFIFVMPARRVSDQRETKLSVLVELNLLLTLDLREQAALQAALVTHGAPDALVTLALTGACRIGSIEEARQLRKWLAEARTAGIQTLPLCT